MILNLRVHGGSTQWSLLHVLQGPDNANIIRLITEMHKPVFIIRFFPMAISGNGSLFAVV